MTVPLKNALVIPQKATYEIQDKKYVFVVDKNNVVKSREIKITGEIPDLYVVKSGITVNDKILLEGVQKVKDDDKIKFEYVQPKKAISDLKLFVTGDNLLTIRGDKKVKDFDPETAGSVVQTLGSKAIAFGINVSF